jgi:anti-sigma factor RsiW
MEAAVSGAEPLAELRAHLEACPACRSAFADERSLFSAIDAGLHVTANSRAPASLLPRVQARVSEESAPRRGWTTSGFALATAAAIVFAFLAAQAVRRTTVIQTPKDVAMNANSPARVTTPPPSQAFAPLPATRNHSVSGGQGAGVRNHPLAQTLVARNTNPQVLVPQDQEILLAAYAKRLRHPKRALLVADKPGETNLEPLQVAPIQIAQLDVKLLAEEQSQ